MTQPNTDLLWLVASVETGEEIAVADDIQESLGFGVFVPVEKVWKMIRGRRVESAQPLFRGYVFVGIVPGVQTWQQLANIDGVLTVLCQPVRVGDRWVSHIRNADILMLQKMQDCGVFDRTTPTPDRFKIGEEVRIGEGLFAGFNAVIQAFAAKMRSATARKRAKLLVQMMGRMTTLEVDVVALEKL